MERSRDEERRHRDGETHEERKQRREEKRKRRDERHARRRQREEPDDHQRSAKRARPESEDITENGIAAATGLFVWKKKIDQQRRRGEETGKDEEIRRQKELAQELEAAKRRRGERDAEKRAWEEEQAKLAREKEQAENADWHQAEASFHGAQHFLRQAIRIRQERPCGTDRLALNLRLDMLDVKPEEKNPVECLAELTLGGVEDLERLAEEVELELEYIQDFPKDEDNNSFNQRVRLDWWECVKICVTSAFESAKAAQVYGGANGVHSAVREDLDALLKGKSLEKLQSMQVEISKKLSMRQTRENNEFAEIGFWTAALARIRRLMAEDKLRNMNSTLLEEREKRAATFVKKEKPTQATPALDHPEGSAADFEMLRKESAVGLREGEEKFAEEVDAVTKKREQPAAGYAWNDKYRPRKPRYYNRVHTGYDWTKYNRTHYDHDNPPPKTVQGYRFNVFYPDLIDPSVTPTFSISRTDNPEVSIITFKAGPPYEDLAFKIVNRPWEHSHRRGYRCSFDKGVLQLWFNFQRYRYRR